MEESVAILLTIGRTASAGFVSAGVVLLAFSAAIGRALMIELGVLSGMAGGMVLALTLAFFEDIAALFVATAG